MGDRHWATARRRLIPHLRRLPEPLEARLRKALPDSLLAAERETTHRNAGFLRPPTIPPRPVRPDGAVILLYHRIAADPNDPFRLCVTPEHFGEHLEVIRRHSDPVPLADVFRRCGPAKRARVAVTFDDGYADNLHAGGPLLDKAGVPAVVYVVTGSIASDKPLWPLRLEELFRLGAPRSDRFYARAAGVAFSVDTPRDGQRDAALAAAHDQLTPMHPNAIAQAMSALEEHFGGDVPSVERRMLDDRELRAMAQGDLFSLGAHTRTHAWLSGLSDEDLDFEIKGCKSDLEDVTGVAVTDFAYPFGTRISFDRAATRSVRKAGFATACTTFDDPLATGTSRFLLPRHPVYDWDGERFERMLLSWLAA